MVNYDWNHSMQLAFSTNAYLNYSFADAVARLAALPGVVCETTVN